jgi:hypothetical protein
LPVDKWGLPFLYPTKKTAGVSGSGTGWFWQQEDDITEDPIVGGSTDLISDINTSTGEFTMNYGDSDSWTIRKDPSFDDTNSIGGCDMDFAATEARGYGWKADQPRDIELKLLLEVLDAPTDDGLSLGGPTGRHSDDGCCSGFAYMFNIEVYREPTVIFRFRKEMWHVNYDTDPETGEFTHPSANFSLVDLGRYVGFAYCRYNVKDGRGPGQDSVVVEGWINPDPDSNKNNWILLKRKEDKGGWGDGGTQCNGDETQVGTWSNGQFRIKSSNTTIRFKNASLREIDPTLSFDDIPETPEDPPDSQTSTVQGSFKIQWDVNTIRSSACAGTGTGGGAGTGAGTFYSVYTDQGVDSDRELSNSTTFQNRKRIVMSPANSSSVFIGKIPEQLDIPLKKVGTPTTPNINAKIWSSSGSVIYTSPTNLDPATLTTSYVKKTFDFSTNTHALVVGDRIGVEWTGTSDASYVVASYKGTSYPNTNYYQYEGSTWESKTRRLVMDVWE